MFHGFVQRLRLEWGRPALPNVRLAAVVLILAYFVQETKFPGRETGIFVFSFLLLFAMQVYLQSNEPIGRAGTWLNSKWKSLMLWTPLAFIGLLAALHPSLVISISGDEVWHVQKANPLLAKLQELAEHGKSYDFQFLQHLGVFDLEVAKVWNFLRLPTLAAGIGLFVLARREVRFGRLIQILLLLSVASIWLQSLIDPHAPLRIFPTLIAQTVFGLSDYEHRLGGPLIAALASVLLVLRVQEAIPKDRKSLRMLIFALPLIPLSLPQISFTIPLVESSSFGLWLWSFAVALCGLDAYEGRAKRFSAVVWIFAIGILVRQGLVALLPFLATMYWPLRHEISLRELLPLTITVPYFLHISGQASPALQGSLSESLFEFFRLDWLPDVAQNFTSWHLPILLLPLVFALSMRSLIPTTIKLIAGSALAIFAYSLLAKGDLFPAGRYQAEYIGGSMAGLLLFQSVVVLKDLSVGRRNLPQILSPVLLFAASAIGVISNWQTASDFPVKQSRTGSSTYLVTAPFFPFEEAISSIENNPSFVVAGGSPYISQARLWNQGATFNSALAWTRLNWQWRSIFEAGAPAEELRTWLVKNQVQYVFRLSDSSREVHHRTEEVKTSMSSIDQLVGQGVLTSLLTSAKVRGDQITIFMVQSSGIP